MNGKLKWVDNEIKSNLIMKKFFIISVLILFNSSFLLATSNAQNIDNVKAEIVKSLNYKLEILDKKNNQKATPKEIKILDDRIEFKLNNKPTIIYFEELLDYTINSSCYRKYDAVLIIKNFEFLMSGWVPSNLERLDVLKDNLILMRDYYEKNLYISQLELFKSIVSQYNAQKEKPGVSEEQRKYIIQANMFNEQMDYKKAIEAYKKAIETDQTSYPAAYFNIALLSAQVDKYDAAIFNMKKYLLLVPNADDARAAQDKIYEWEALIGK